MSYRLLLWLGGAIDRGLIMFTRAHNYEKAADAAYDWIDEHYDRLPETSRPPRNRLREFSNFFGSYTTTSFDLIEKPGTRLESCCGCYCSLCVHLVNASHLRPKEPRNRDKKMAREKRILRLITLAAEEGLRITIDLATELATSPGLLKSAAYSAYGQSLIERVGGSEGGPYVLALWREIAWKPEGSPIKGFQLEAADILDAERQLIAEMRRVGSSSAS